MKYSSLADAFNFDNIESVRANASNTETKTNNDIKKRRLVVVLSY